ncbi:MAG: carbon-nitrogen hydrolase family protein [Planctomycetota bacterium]
MRSLHIAAAQIHSGGDPAGTLERARVQIRMASIAGAQVILFAECALQGYDYDMTDEMTQRMAIPADGPECDRVIRMAADHDISILMGFFERDGDRVYNSQLVARPDGMRDVERKHELTKTERQAGLSPGEAARKVFQFHDVRAAIIICADGGMDGLHERLEKKDIDFRFCPTAGGGQIDEMLHESRLDTPEGREAYTKNRKQVFKPEPILPEEECPNTGFAAANALGRAGKSTCHQGHCMIVDNRGVMRAQIPGTNVLEHQQDRMIHARLSFPER